MAEPFGLTEAARSRLATPMQGRELAAIAVVGIPFLLLAGLLAATGVDGDVDTLDVVLFVLAAAVMAHLEFETGAGSLVPTQLIFVPMLFVLPPAIVPLVVAAALALDRLPEGVRARVVSVAGAGAVSRRLMEMGVVPGAPVRVVKAAPLGDPIEVRVRTYHLALRRAEANTIQVVTSDD